MTRPSGEQPPTASINLNALALSFLGLLLLIGGALMLTLVLAIRQFPTALRHGELVYVVPGSGGQHALEPAIIAVLAGVGGVFASVGLLGLVIGRVVQTRPARFKIALRPSQPRNHAARPARTLMIGIAVLAAVLIFRWLVPHA